MKNTLRCLILIYFSVYNVQGDDPSCSENSWNAFACIQYLQRSLAELQDQMKIQAVHLESHSDDLSKQSFQLENLSIRLDNQSLQMENQTSQLESHSVKLNTLADLSSTQSLQLEIVSSQVVTLSAVVTAQSTQLTAQSIQLTYHSSELFALIENSTSHSVQLATNSVKLDDQSAQLQSQSTQLNTHATQLTSQSALLEGLQNNSIPIGFIYVQLPSQSPPYSESFETIQAENSPRITLVQTGNSNTHVYHNYIYPDDQLSVGVTSGAWAINAEHWTLRFKQSGGEVRPRNTAVRIWKRMN